MLMIYQLAQAKSTLGILIHINNATIDGSPIIVIAIVQ